MTCSRITCIRTSYMAWRGDLPLRNLPQMRQVHRARNHNDRILDPNGHCCALSSPSLPHRYLSFVCNSSFGCSVNWDKDGADVLMLANFLLKCPAAYKQSTHPPRYVYIVDVEGSLSCSCRCILSTSTSRMTHAKLRMMCRGL